MRSKANLEGFKREETEATHAVKPTALSLTVPRGTSFPYRQFFLLGNFISGKGGYSNAQPAKAYFGKKLSASTFWVWSVCDIQAFYHQKSKL